MKTLILALGLITTLYTNAQTTLYYYKEADSSVYKNNYVYIDHSTGKMYGCKVSPEGKKESNPVHVYPYSSTTIEIDSNKIYAYVKAYHRDEKTKIMKEDSVETKFMLGYITDDKKIIAWKNSVSNNEATAFYIKGNKIFNSSNTIIRQFEGEENYAVACLLCQMRQ
jgi:hypothetical protein